MNFDHDLLRFDSDVVDDVIVRELLHFFVPQPGKTVEKSDAAHLGRFEAAEEKLRQPQR